MYEFIQTMALVCTATFTFGSMCGIWFRASIAYKEYKLKWWEHIKYEKENKMPTANGGTKHS